MSLVDYASSSGEEEDEHEHEQGRSTQAIVADPEAATVTNGREGEEDAKTMDSAPPPPPMVISRENQNRASVHHSSGPSESSYSRPAIQLPDASLLFESPSSGRLVVGTDHASRVTAAINENTSRKRDSNGFSPQISSNKHPRGNTSNTRNRPNIPGNLLPPQLRGRSNVVTEDINKLFINRNGAP